MVIEEHRQAERDVAVLKASLGESPEPLARPVLVMLAGLPGSGKTYLSRRVVERFPMLVLESDALRRTLFDRLEYSPEESRRLFRAVHRLLYDLLKRGLPVVLDATNLEAAHRQMIYNVAEKAGARVIVVEVRAPQETIRRRLRNREVYPDEGASDAGWEVYQRMRRTAEKIRRRHFIADTLRDVTPVINRILREIRRSQES